MGKKEFFTVKELSNHINVKPKTIYSWVSKRILPCYQFEGLLRFEKTEIDQWLNQKKQPFNNLEAHHSKLLEQQNRL